MSIGGSNHRIRGLFEMAVSNDMLCNSVVLWHCYIGYEMNIAHDPYAAPHICFLRTRSKLIWLDGFLSLKSVLTGSFLI